MSDALSTVEELYFGLQRQIGVLSLAMTPDEKNAFMTKYLAAQNAYNACVDKMFADDDPELDSLVDQLKSLNDEISHSVEEMGNISKVLDRVTQAVTIAGQIAAL